MSKESFNKASNIDRRMELIERILERARQNGNYDEVHARIKRMEAVTQRPLTDEERDIIDRALEADEIGESRVIRAFNIVADIEGRKEFLTDNAAEEKRKERALRELDDEVGDEFDGEDLNMNTTLKIEP